MGILSDFFVADPERAKAIKNVSELPSNCYAMYKGFTELELGFLWQIHDNKPLDFDPSLGFQLISEAEETFTTEFPPEFTNILSNLNDDAIPNLAIKWAACEELSCDGKDLIPVIEDLRRLAQLANAKNRRLYLWNST